jgi:serine/threonine-protein kinase
MSDEGLIANLLKRWQAARESGPRLSAKEVCADHPMLIDEVERRIRDLEAQEQASETMDIASVATGVAPRAGDREERLEEDMLLELRFSRRQFHAKGGLGAVYTARDGRLHREVALKFIRSDHDQDPETRVLFLREAEITAGLDHPGVVPVYGVGTTREGAPFYAMRFIQGETLEDAIRQVYDSEKRPRFLYRSLAFRRLLSEFIAVCKTVGYAHNRGIVHRDIKPDNVMLGKYGETLLVDWGLALPVGRDERAKASGEMTLRPRSGNDSGQSSSGSGGGTPAYMSPEQAEGSLNIGPATDIYSLGATLFKIIAGEAPFNTRGVSLRDLLENVKQGKYPRPTQVRPGAPKELESVCLKAMARDPDRRYRGPLEIAKEVENWLADEPVAAHQEGLGERLSRWSRRHRTAVQAGVSGLFLLCVIALFGAVWFSRLAGREREARQHGLALSAKFAARTVANDMDLRWRILESEANDPELRDMLTRAVDQPPESREWKDLQKWLDSRHINYANSPGNSGWFMADTHGNLVALSVVGDDADEKRRKNIGRNLAHKDFFHGLGRELTKEEAKTAEPITQVHLSTAYLSTSDPKLKVAFSVPIFAADKKARPLGILAMSVDLGQFATLQTELGQNQLAALCDTRPAFINNEEQRGLLLHHPYLEQGKLAGLKPEQLLFRVPAERLKLFQELRATRLHQNPASGPVEPGVLVETFEAAYSDPVGGKYAGEWMAAWEPVLVNGRPAAIKDTGWIVIVQERK